jgi:hypothetical protein
MKYIQLLSGYNIQADRLIDINEKDDNICVTIRLECAKYVY